MPRVLPTFSELDAPADDAELAGVEDAVIEDDVEKVRGGPPDSPALRPRPRGPAPSFGGAPFFPPVSGPHIDIKGRENAFCVGGVPLPGIYLAGVEVRRDTPKGRPPWTPPREPPARELSSPFPLPRSPLPTLVAVSQRCCEWRGMGRVYR